MNQTISVTVEFGDGTSESREVTNLGPSPAPVTFSHTYPFSRLENNTYTVTALLANGVSNLTTTGELMFEEPIQSLAASVDPEIANPGAEVILTAVLDGFSVVHLTVNWDDGNVSYVTQPVNGSTEIQASHVFLEEGDFIVQLSAANAISEKNVTVPETVVIRRNLSEKLDLTVNEFVDIQTGTTVHVASLDGSFSEVTCVWTFGEESGAVESDLNSTSPMAISLDTSGLSPGTELFTANCSNPASSVILTGSMQLVAPIGDAFLQLSSDATLASQLISYTLEVTGGSNLTYSLSFGDGDVRTISDANSRELVQRAHSLIGQFAIRFTASNPLGSKTSTAQLTVLQKISELSLEASGIDRVTGETFASDRVPNATFPATHDVHISAGLSAGSSVTYSFQRVGDDVTTTRESAMTLRPPSAGTHTFLVTASNALSSVSASIEVTLLDRTALKRLSNDGPRRLNESVTLTLEFERLGTDTCLLVDFGDGEKSLYGEHLDACANILDDISPGEAYALQSAVVTAPMVLLHDFPHAGSFYAQAVAFNAIAESLTASTVSITSWPCRYPAIHIEGSGRTVDHPRVHTRSENILINRDVTVDCPASSGAEFVWTAALLTQVGELEYINTPVTLAALSASNSGAITSLLLTSGALQAGERYNLTLTVTMSDVPEVWQSANVYLYVRSAPLILKLVGGSGRAVGFGTEFSVDAASLSSDPDADVPGDTSDWSFVWLCYREGEAEPDLVHAQTVAVPETPIFIDETNDGGGCFGTGPGRLNVSTHTGESGEELLIILWFSGLLAQCFPKHAENQNSLYVYHNKDCEANTHRAIHIGPDSFVSCS